MTDVAISVEGVSKLYHIGKTQARYRTFRDSVVEAVTNFSSHFKKSRPETIWALQDISFEVNSGEVIGVIGRNGSGKSTLLKILSRITKPTKGTATVRGRVGSLLEVGTGFHQELTGRENIYLNGAILGMKKAEIERKFDAIVEFSEIEKFLDTPVKRYSSGMYVRLAFSVAAHLDPEILLVDEVLAVGDVAFQRKCLGKMGEMSQSGRTVLFVSHNLGVISRLCQKTLWLDQGAFVKMANTREVVHDYLSDSSVLSIGTWHNEAANQNVNPKLLSASVANEQSKSVSVVNFGEDFYLLVQYEILEFVEVWSLLFRVKDVTGTTIFTSWDTDSNLSSKQLNTGTHWVKCHIPKNILRPGNYSVTLGTYIPRAATYNVHEDIFQFQISSVNYPMNSDRMGIITPVLAWSIEEDFSGNAV